MPTNPRISYINIPQLPQGYTSRRSPYSSNKFTKLENWWPSPNDFGAIEVVPGFSSVSSSNLGSNTASAVISLYSGVKSDGTTKRFAAYNTASGLDVAVVSVSGSPSTAGQTGLTSDQPVFSVVYNDLVFFFNGSDAPFKYDFSADTASAFSAVGLTQPTLGGATSAIGTGTNVKGVVKYFVSFMTSTTEGPMSSVFGEIDAGNGNGIDLSSIPTGGGGVTARKLYRTTRDAEVPLYLATIEDNATTTYTDDIKDRDLGAPPIIHGGTPGTTLNFPIVHFNRLWAIADDRLYFSDRVQPESWFSENNYPINIDDGDAATGLFRDSEGIFIFKNRHIYKLLVTDPQAELARLIELTPSDPSSFSLGTPSHRSLTPIDGGIIFYSNKGFYQISNGREISYLSGDIEDELRDDINEAQESKITGIYYPKYRLFLASVPTGASTENDTTYGYFVDQRAWFKITEGFKDFVLTRDSNNAVVLWGSHTDDDSKIHLLLDLNTNTFNGTNISSEAILPVLSSSSPSRLSRFLKFDTEFEAKASGNLILGYKLDRSTTTNTASVSMVNSGFDSKKATMAIGQQARLLEVVYKTNADQPAAKVYNLTIPKQGMGNYNV